MYQRQTIFRPAGRVGILVTRGAGSEDVGGLTCPAAAAVRCVGGCCARAEGHFEAAASAPWLLAGFVRLCFDYRFGVLLSEVCKTRWRGTCSCDVNNFVLKENKASILER